MRQQEYGERGRKKERLFFHLSASFLVAGLFATTLTGCQNSIQTEEQIVTPQRRDAGTGDRCHCHGNIDGTAADAGAVSVFIFR